MKRVLTIVGVVLAVVVVGIAFALWRLDALLTDQARVAAADFGQQLGRPITVGKVSTSLFPPLSVEVTEVSVGAAPGESKPLVSLQRLSAQVDAFAAATSGGKDLRVRDAELSGLVVNVLRFADGTTNVERLLATLEKDAGPEAAPTDKAQGEAFDLSGLIVQRAALLDGRFALVDEGTPGTKELAISDFDVEVRDLRVGHPLELLLKAGVLSPTQNFELQVKTAALTPDLQVTPTFVGLKANAIDLGPLGPFLGSAVGLRAGLLSADWKLTPGALVPGGSGETAMVGKIEATGLRFDAQERGKPLDVLVDTDVKLDALAGAAQIQALNIALGPAARITGKGRVAKLYTGAPETDGFELVAREIDLDALTAYYPPLRQQLAQQVGGVVSFDVRGEGSANQQTVVASLDLTRARLNIPGQLAKAAGQPFTVKAQVAGAAAQQSVRFDATADLAGVDLRPGQSLNKAPGQPLSVQARGSYMGGATTHVKVDSLAVNLLGDLLTGTASVELGGGGNPDALAFQFEGKATKLDADRLLLPSPQEKQPGAPSEASAPAGAAAPQADPDRFKGMSGTMKVAIGQLRYAEQDLEDVLVQLKMVNDQVTMERMSVKTMGGRVALDGSTLQLGPARMPYDLKIQLEGIEIASALAKRMPKQMFTGKLTGNFSFAGAGFTAADLAETLTGALKGQINGGTYEGLDIIGATTAALAKAVPFAGNRLPASGKGVSLGKILPFGMHIEKGVAVLDKPLAIDDAQAIISATGGIKMTGDLALDGTVGLKPATIATLTGGKVKLDAPLPVTFKLVGPASAPRIEGIDVKPAARLLLEKGGRAALSQALGGRDQEAEAKVRAEAEKAKAALAAQQAALEQRKAEERARLEAAAKQEADKRKQQAADEAKKKLKGFFK